MQVMNLEIILPLPVDAPLTLIFFSQYNLSLSLHLVLLASINSCSLFILLFILYCIVFIHFYFHVTFHY